MKLQVLYFARLRETLGIDSESLDTPDNVKTVADLMNWLAARNEVFAAEFSGKRVIRVAVNQEVAWPDTRLTEGEEVAFFPPVTGG